MEFSFECPQCDSSVEPMENTRLLDAMEGRIEDLRAELNVDTAPVEV